MNQTEFVQEITSKVEGELLIPFEDLDLDFDQLKDLNTERLLAITKKQEEIVGWCKTIPGCNWSVGYVDNEEQNNMVIKWWFGTRKPSTEAS